MSQPQYPQLLRALAMQRLGAGDNARGSVADWQMLSQAHMARRASGRPGDSEPLGPAPPSRPGPWDPLNPSTNAFAARLRQKLAMRMARTGRPPMAAPAPVGSQIPTTVRGGQVA